jgi:uncharacterized protein YcbK (DUF882 family)
VSPSRIAHAASCLRLRVSVAAPAFGALAILLASTGTSGNAIANGETRTLEIFHTHTKESATITYKRNGQFDREGLEKLNWILRDWRRDEPTSMDPRLFDIVWEVRREVGSQEPLNIVSAYRAPETNAMLRRRSRTVAKHSQHMLGKAMDFFLPDVEMAKVREIALRLQRGGVGYYPTAFNPFVHLDAGSVRHWPRMTRDQLARLFPDGKTVHIPADGRPMPGYDEAAAEIERNGGSVSAYADAGDEDSGFFSGGKGKSFFAALFGLKDDVQQEQARTQAQVTRRSSRVAKAEPVTATDAPAPKVEPYETVIRAAPDPEPGPSPEKAPQPAPAQPVAVASLPPTAKEPARPAEPQLVWQAGPDGAEATDAAAPALPTVPMPLARPPELAAMALPPLTMPLPPERPVTLAALGSSRLTDAGIGTPDAISAAPDAGVPGVSAYVPLPPLRPGAVPGMRPADHVAVAPVPAAPAGASRSPEPAPALDRGGLKALFASASLVGPSGGRAAVRTARTQVAARDLTGLTGAPSSSVVVKFGRQDDLRIDRFSGPAVRPLEVERFVP